MLFCFTHDVEVNWMLPAAAPASRYVEVHLIAVVRFRGDRLYNEHICGDQASVLVQIGALDPTNPPIAVIEPAKELIDQTLPSNRLMKRWAEIATP